MTFQITCIHNLVQFGLLSGHLLVNSCSLGKPYNFYCLCILTTLKDFENTKGEKYFFAPRIF